jgi:hypothetical protein
VHGALHLHLLAAVASWAAHRMQRLHTHAENPSVPCRRSAVLLARVRVLADGAATTSTTTTTHTPTCIVVARSAAAAAAAAALSALAAAVDVTLLSERFTAARAPHLVLPTTTTSAATDSAAAAAALPLPLRQRLVQARGLHLDGTNRLLAQRQVGVARRLLRRLPLGLLGVASPMEVLLRVVLVRCAPRVAFAPCRRRMCHRLGLNDDVLNGTTNGGLVRRRVDHGPRGAAGRRLQRLPTTPPIQLRWRSLSDTPVETISPPATPTNSMVLHTLTQLVSIQRVGAEPGVSLPAVYQSRRVASGSFVVFYLVKRQLVLLIVRQVTQWILGCFHAHLACTRASGHAVVHQVEVTSDGARTPRSHPMQRQLRHPRTRTRIEKRDGH